MVALGTLLQAFLTQTFRGEGPGGSAKLGMSAKLYSQLLVGGSEMQFPYFPP